MVLLSSTSIYIVVSLIIVWYMLSIYSRSYLVSSRYRSRYSVYISLFIYSMLLLLLSSSIVYSLYAYEIIGLCSYLLVGYHSSRYIVSSASIKAVVYTKPSDIILYMVAITLIYPLLSYTTIPTILSILILLSSIGKSSLLLIHVWLLDAMEGPTIVSTILHSSTLVTAGYVLVSSIGISLSILSILGILSMVYTTLLATSISDSKVSLAYSTIVNMGLLSIVSSDVSYHSYTHAMVKSILFLSIGILVYYYDSYRYIPSNSSTTIYTCISILLLSVYGMIGVTYTTSEDSVISIGIYSVDSIIYPLLVSIAGMYVYSSVLRIIEYDSIYSSNRYSIPSLSMIVPVLVGMIVYSSSDMICSMIVPIDIDSIYSILSILSIQMVVYSKDRIITLYSYHSVSIVPLVSYMSYIASSYHSVSTVYSVSMIVVMVSYVSIYCI